MLSHGKNAQPIAGTQSEVDEQHIPDQGGINGPAINAGTWTAEDVSTSRKNILELIESQGFMCRLTGQELTPSIATPDHIQSLKDGGKNDMTNIQIIHTVVNTMKGTLSQAAFIEWCCRVADHTRGLLDDSTEEYF